MSKFKQGDFAVHTGERHKDMNVVVRMLSDDGTEMCLWCNPDDYASADYDKSLLTNFGDIDSAYFVQDDELIEIPRFVKGDKVVPSGLEDDTGFLHYLHKWADTQRCLACFFYLFGDAVIAFSDPTGALKRRFKAG